MDDDNRSLVPVPDDSLANTAAGAKRIVSAMVSETLAIGRLQQVGGEVFRLLIGNLDEPTAEAHAQLVQIALGEKFTGVPGSELEFRSRMGVLPPAGARHAHGAGRCRHRGRSFVLAR